MVCLPQVALRTGIETAEGREEVLFEYFCDYPGCTNVADHLLGCAREIQRVLVACDEHFATLEAGAWTDPAGR